MYRRSQLFRLHWADIRVCESYIVPGGRIYEQREFIYNALTDIPGITAVKPKAAFYMFLRLIQRNLIS